MPASLRTHPQWGEYLLARSELVVDLRDEVHARALSGQRDRTADHPHRQIPTRTHRPEDDPQDRAGDRPEDRAAAWTTTPAWARNRLRPEDPVVADVEVWRAAMHVGRNDHRPTGRPMLAKAQARYQRSLDRRITGDRTPAMQEWGHVLSHALGGSSRVRADDFAPQLAERLSAISRAGIDAGRLVRQEVHPDGSHQAAEAPRAFRPLPDDHAAAALWWRISGRLSPAVAAQMDQDGGPYSLTNWTPRLAELVGADRADRIQASTWWPALTTVVEHARQRGWQLDALLGLSARAEPNEPWADAAACDTGSASARSDGIDEAQAMLWRASIALDPVPADPDHPESEEEASIPDPFGPGAAPEDLWTGYHPEHQVHSAGPALSVSLDDLDGLKPDGQAGPQVEGIAEADADDDADEVFRRLRQVALTRDLNAARHIQLPPSGAEEARAYEREVDRAASPVSETRMLEINALAHAFFEQHLPGSWGQRHLRDRFGLDSCSTSGTSQLRDQFRPGQAPAGWTNLAKHLRRHGVADEELLATGLVTTASTGRLIDRFRDRVVFPITAPGRVPISGDGERGPVQILGFVGRRHPDLVDVDPATGEHDIKAGPKYLNTADTLIFHKGAQLYAGYYGDAQANKPDEAVQTNLGTIGSLLEAGAVPVVVEGPMDAIAITAASAGVYVGVAPLGTSFTEEQASQLASLHHRTGVRPIVATDPDTAGRVAAERAYWMLATHGVDPDYARLPAHTDPADLLVRRGPAGVAAALAAAVPLAGVLLDERLDHLDRIGLTQTARVGDAPPVAVSTDLARLVAAQDPGRWMDDIARIAERLHQPVEDLQRNLLGAAKAWELDPRQPAQQALGGIHQVRQRLAATEMLAPSQRWAPLGAALDSRLPQEPDWGAAAMMIQDGHDQGHHVAAAARALVAEQPLGDRPAQDLRYRLADRLNIDIPDFDDVNPQTPKHPAVGRSEAPNAAPGVDASGPTHGGGRGIADHRDGARGRPFGEIGRSETHRPGTR